MFDSTYTTTLDPELIKKLNIIAQIDYCANMLEIFLDITLRINATKLPEPIKIAIVKSLAWSMLKVKKTFTDEVLDTWTTANEKRALAKMRTHDFFQSFVDYPALHLRTASRTWTLTVERYVEAIRVTVVTISRWLAG